MPQLLGGIGIGVALVLQFDVGVIIGSLFAWAGGLTLLVGLIAYGVKFGIEAAAPSRQAS